MYIFVADDVKINYKVKKIWWLKIYNTCYMYKSI